METINEILVQLEQEPVDDQNVFEMMFAKMWGNIVNLDQLNDDFDQDLASVLLSIDTSADISQMARDVGLMVQNPFKFHHQLNVKNCKLYLDSISNQESWNTLYDQFIDIIPFTTPMGKLVFSEMNLHSYKMYKESDKGKLKEIIIDFYTNKIKPLLNITTNLEEEGQQIV